MLLSSPTVAKVAIAKETANWPSSGSRTGGRTAAGARLVRSRWPGQSTAEHAVFCAISCFRDAELPIESAFFSALIHERANVWEVPFLLKGQWGERHAFFAGGGYSLQSIRGTESTIVTTLNPSTGERDTQRARAPTSWELGEGVVAASGFKLRRGRLVLSPEIRYTRWLIPAIDVSRSRGFVFSSARNQFDFFLGIGWGLR